VNQFLVHRWNARIVATYLGFDLAKLQHRYELRLAVIAAIALFFAQIGAITHAYSHTPEKRAVSTQPTPGAHDTCNDCLNFAPLLAATGGPAILPYVPPAGRSVVPQTAFCSFVDFRPRLAFRARAPPVTR
jgi:hypothetical protein